MRNLPTCFLFMLVLLSSCRKESEMPISMKPKNSYTASVYNDIIRFENKEKLFACIQFLELRNSEKNKFFVDSVSGRITDSLSLTIVEMEKIDSIFNNNGYNHKLIYEEFEFSNWGYVSLRKFIEPLQEAYMLSGEEDLDPSIRYPYSEELKTILNQYEELIIGDTIYKMIQNGQTLIKTHVNFYNSIVQIRTNENLAFSDSLVILVYDSKSACKSFVWGKKIMNYNIGNKKFRLKTYCSLVFGYLTSVTNHYRVQNNGSLIWSIANIQTGVFTSELYKSKPCNSNNYANIKEGGKDLVKDGYGSKLKSPINWFHQSIIIGDGVSFYFTPSQKTNSVSFCSTCSNSGLYLTAYAW